MKPGLWNLNSVLFAQFRSDAYKYMLAEVWCLKIIAELSRSGCSVNSKNLADPWVAYINEKGNKSSFLLGKLQTPYIYSS